MSEVKNIPRLRFRNFDEIWSKTTLQSTCEVNPRSHNLPNRFVYIDLESVEHGKLLFQNEISKDGSPSRAQRLLQRGDIIYQTVRPYQKNNYLFDLDGDYVASTGYAQLRTNQNSSFLYQLIHTEKFVNKVLLRSTGSNYPAINSTDLKKINFNIPSLPEQQKIADFLTAVDKRIELLEKKKTLLETFKKGVIKKIFNQEIRFKDDNGNEFPDWEKKRLGELSLKMKSGGTPKSTIKDYYDGDIPFLSIGDMTSQNKYLNWTSKTISKRGLENSSSWVVPKNSIIYSMYASVGFVSINKIDLSISQAVMAIQPIDEMNLEFLYYSLLNFQPKIKSLIETGTQGNINGGIVKNIPIDTPSLNEQIKISEFLSSIDIQIEISETQIEKSKTWKKGLLQKMFV